MDAGPVWATAEFPMREATKSSLYRNEVTEAAGYGRARNIEPLRARGYSLPEAASPSRAGIPGGDSRQRTGPSTGDRDSAAAVLRKIRSADGNPGLKSRFCGRSRLSLRRAPGAALKGEPGEIVARSGPAVARRPPMARSGSAACATPQSPYPFKLPATRVLGNAHWRCPRYAGGRRGRLSRDFLRGGRRRGLSAFPLLQRRHGHGSLRAPACGLSRGARAPDPRARAHGRAGLLVQRHGSQSHRGCGQPRRSSPGAISTPSTISPMPSSVPEDRH